MQRISRDKSGLTIRLAADADLPAINEMYNHYVVHSTCTWQVEPHTPRKRKAWFLQHDARHPVTVAELGGQIVGWGALSVFRDPHGYRHTVENSVYVRPDSQRKGVGSAILEDLIRRARDLGHRCIVAVISGDQAPSLALHAEFGFAEMGRLHEVGEKFGRWLDVVFLVRKLQES